MITEFISPDIHCQKCAVRVRTAMEHQPGIRKLEIDPAAHKVTVEYDESAVTCERLRATLAEAGYPPVNHG